MRRRRVMLVLAGAAAVWWAAPPAVMAAPAGGAGTWRTAIEVPGLGSLNTGGNAGVSSVSCASAGNCAAGGFYTVSYTDGSSDFHAFVVSEQNGTWRKAIEVPGSGMLNKGGAAGVKSVSCASAGNCAAAEPTTTAPVTSRRSWSASRTAPGARRSRCPARGR